MSGWVEISISPSRTRKQVSSMTTVTVLPASAMPGRSLCRATTKVPSAPTRRTARRGCDDVDGPVADPDGDGPADQGRAELQAPCLRQHHVPAGADHGLELHGLEREVVLGRPRRREHRQSHRFGRPWLGCRGLRGLQRVGGEGVWAEDLGRCGHLQRLVGSGVVVAMDPRVDRGLGRDWVGEGPGVAALRGAGSCGTVRSSQSWSVTSAWSAAG